MRTNYIIGTLSGPRMSRLDEFHCIYHCTFVDRQGGVGRTLGAPVDYTGDVRMILETLPGVDVVDHEFIISVVNRLTDRCDVVGIRESVDSLCRDDADMPIPPYIGKAYNRPNAAFVSLFR